VTGAMLSRHRAARRRGAFRRRGAPV